MRRRVVIASTVAAAVTATALAVTAAQADQDVTARDSVAAAATRNVIVVERAVTDAVVDNAPKGDSAGDLLTFANPIYNRTNAKRVGHNQGSCIRTVVGKAWQCSWTTWLDKGSLVVEGPFFDKHDSVLAITGGTGRYASARGVMHLHARNAKGTAFTFRFTIRD